MRFEDLTQPKYKSIHNLLSQGWRTRKELGKILSLSENQVTGIMSRLREKGFSIVVRQSKKTVGFKEYAIGFEGYPYKEDYGSKSIKVTRDLLIMEMNKIRLESISCGNRVIEKMSTRALEIIGLNTEQ